MAKHLIVDIPVNVANILRGQRSATGRWVRLRPDMIAALLSYMRTREDHVNHALAQEIVHHRTGGYTPGEWATLRAAARIQISRNPQAHAAGQDLHYSPHQAFESFILPMDVPLEEQVRWMLAQVKDGEKVFEGRVQPARPRLLRPVPKGAPTGRWARTKREKAAVVERRKVKLRAAKHAKRVRERLTETMKTAVGEAFAVVTAVDAQIRTEDAVVYQTPARATWRDGGGREKAIKRRIVHTNRAGRVDGLWRVGGKYVLPEFTTLQVGPSFRPLEIEITKEGPVASMPIVPPVLAVMQKMSTSAPSSGSTGRRAARAFNDWVKSGAKQLSADAPVDEAAAVILGAYNCMRHMLRGDRAEVGAEDLEAVTNCLSELKARMQSGDEYDRIDLYPVRERLSESAPQALLEASMLMFSAGSWWRFGTARTLFSNVEGRDLGPINIALEAINRIARNDGELERGAPESAYEVLKLYCEKAGIELPSGALGQQTRETTGWVEPSYVPPPQDPPIDVEAEVREHWRLVEHLRLDQISIVPHFIYDANTNNWHQMAEYGRANGVRLRSELQAGLERVLELEKRLVKAGVDITRLPSAVLAVSRVWHAEPAVDAHSVRCAYARDLTFCMPKDEPNPLTDWMRRFVHPDRLSSAERSGGSDV